MSDPYESPLSDLFDFPEVEGLEEFGLVPPVPANMRVPVAQGEPLDAARASDLADSADSARSADRSPTAAPTAAAAPARPNPPTPEAIDDLDEDLFHFDELFSLDDDPYQNGTLNADGLPANDIFLDPTAAASVIAQPAPVAVEDAVPAAQPQPQAAPQPVPQPVPQPQAPPQHATGQAPAAPLPSSSPPPLPGDESMRSPGAAYALRDRGPRILLPEDIPYSPSSEKQRLLWILVACFLFVNTGIFYIAYQSSAAFQSSLQVTTDKLADAIAQDNAAPSTAQPSQFPATSASIGTDPTLHHTVNMQGTLPAGSDLPDRSSRDRWIDPRDYANTHDFAVGNAKALLADGRFEEARRLLNYVLANQARIPLSPVLREEIDYLIPLTYFEHGNATAPSVEETP